MKTDIYYTYASKKELLDIGVKEDTIFERISQIDEMEEGAQGLNQAELTQEQCAALIPEGGYCYTHISNGRGGYEGFVRIQPCPFWDRFPNFPKQDNGYCHYLKRGDWQGTDLLWDQCKCCGINDN